MPIRIGPRGSGWGADMNIAFRAQLVVPEQRQLYDYWLEKAADRPMPCRADISPAHIPRLLPHISLIDVGADTACCRVRLAGTRLRDIYDREITGLQLKDMEFGDKADYWMAAYRRTIDEGKPAQGIVRGPTVNKEHLVQYWLKLPLAQNGSRDVAIVLCLDFFLPAAEDGPLAGIAG